jgi:hypothetical protein
VSLSARGSEKHSPKGREYWNQSINSSIQLFVVSAASVSDESGSEPRPAFVHQKSQATAASGESLPRRQ